MKFWDSSALVMLLVHQPRTAAAQAIYAEDGEMLVWWGSLVECSSALARLERETRFSIDQADTSRELLAGLQQHWHEVQPSERLRQIALRLLRVHALRSADALQLAAAIQASGSLPASLGFVCFDERLALAARKEGFRLES